MKKTLIINEKAHIAYITDDLIKEGYRGEVEMLANFNTVALLRPGSTKEEQIKSLERLVEDLRDRRDAENRENHVLEETSEE